MGYPIQAPRTETQAARPSLAVPPDLAQTVTAPAALRFSEVFVAHMASAHVPERISASTASSATRFLRSVYAQLPALPPPTIGQGNDGMVGMTWQNDTDHVNVEIFADGHLELFHEDLRTGEVWHQDDVVTPRPTPDLLLRLARLG